MRQVCLKFGISIILGILLTSAFMGTMRGGTVHAAASKASSSPCWASGCNHLDPYAMGCRSSAYAVKAAHKDVVIGSYHFLIDNWYSPNCNANWTVATILSGSIQFVEISSTVSDCYPNLPGSYYCDPGAADITASPAWTNMVDGSVKATACVTPFHPASPICSTPV